MNYTYENNEYIANDGYMFVHKTNGICFTKMSLSVSDSIENYDCVEIPPEPEIENEEVIVDEQS